MADQVVSPFSRMFLIENGAAPNHTPIYEGLWKAGALSAGQGTNTPIRIPSKNAYGKFETVGSIQGDAPLPELPVTARYTLDLSDLLRLTNLGCTHDVQVHFGTCQLPSNFNGGWDKVLVLETARISDYKTTELGALEPGDNAVVDEPVTFQGELVYEIKKLSATEISASNVTGEVVAVSICDQAGCGGTCGSASDGCQKVFFVQLAGGVSPGIAASVVYSDDGMGTSAKTGIATLAIGEAPNDAACVGDNLVVISEDSESLHYANISDILAAAETWAEVTTGFVAAKGPLAMWSLGPSETWIVGEGGYIYFTDDPTSGVEVQDAGVATIQDLNDVHVFDSEHAVAVGASNAVVRTTDGTIWGAKTGPAVGVVLNAVWMKSADVWFVGTAGGALYYTNDGGDSWTLKGFSGSGTGSVTDIYFATNSVGYMTHTTAAGVGRLFRTIDGGNSWVLGPESGSMPDNDRINKVRACDANKVFAGGLGGGASDGFAVKLS